MGGISAIPSFFGSTVGFSDSAGELAAAATGDARLKDSATPNLDLVSQFIKSQSDRKIRDRELQFASPALAPPVSLNPAANPVTSDAPTSPASIERFRGLVPA